MRETFVCLFWEKEKWRGKEGESPGLVVPLTSVLVCALTRNRTWDFGIFWMTHWPTEWSGQGKTHFFVKNVNALLRQERIKYSRNGQAGHFYKWQLMLIFVVKSLYFCICFHLLLTRNKRLVRIIRNKVFCGIPGSVPVGKLEVTLPRRLCLLLSHHRDKPIYSWILLFQTSRLSSTDITLLPFDAMLC